MSGQIALAFCPVNPVCQQTGAIGREPDGPLIKTRIRIAAYLRGCFARGAIYTLWNPEKFARATLSKNPISAKHVRRAWPLFRELSQSFRFELVRVGRSNKWRVEPLEPVQPKPRTPQPRPDQIAYRLSRYIRAAVKAARFAYVNRGFLATFCKSAGATMDEALAALEVVKVGGAVRVGTGFESRFSLPHFSQAVSSEHSSEIRNIKKPRARGAPFEILGRMVSGAKLAALAAWLATGPMRAEIWDNCRVKWRFAHARNFALAALRAGHDKAAILSAWRKGVRLSHADAVDCLETGSREPSAAVAYARRALPSGSAVENWRAWLAGPDLREVRAAEARETARAARFRADLAPISTPAPTPPPSPAPAADLGDMAARLRAWVSARMPWAEFAALPFALQRDFFTRFEAEAGA